MPTPDRALAWPRIIATLRSATSNTVAPSVTFVARSRRDPFTVLISTMISLRTKDQVTTDASARLFALADTPQTMARLEETAIAEAIYPAGFYRTKARNIRTVASLLVAEHDGAVPATLDALLQLPGVGRKTANLVLGLGFGIPAICVDTHVHRISNRLGWVATNTPEQSESALMDVLPQTYWIEINDLLVRFGQTICTPTSPHCSTCPLAQTCPHVGVTKSR